MDELFDFLIKKDVKYDINQPMSQYTSVRIGGCASVVAFPRSEDQLIDLVRFLIENKIKYRVIGRMTNILPCDCEYTGVLVSTRLLDNYTCRGTTVIAECGVSVSSLILQCARINLGGLESLYAIPGSLGGMIVSNAGAYGTEIGDFVKSVRAYSPDDDQVHTIDKEKIGFSYRNSLFLRKYMVIIAAELELDESSFEIIREKLGKIRDMRALSQPVDHPSLGSVFKKIDGVSAGQIIDRCGLKGLKVGGAMVSTKHAGFIVNTGDATAADFCELIARVKREVYRQCGILLEEEINLM